MIETQDQAVQGLDQGQQVVIDYKHQNIPDPETILPPEKRQNTRAVFNSY